MIQKAEKVSVYIDGFNLYFGMISKYEHTKWLNIEALSEALLKPNQKLEDVKYFTARISNNPSKEQRQKSYIDAIKTTRVKIIFGHYKSKPKSCNRCGHSWNTNEEKMTDVNIAVNMLTDAMDDKYDIALLISGDSDLVPPIHTIHKYFPEKRVVVAFPPNRHNNSVKNAAKGSFIIGRSKLVQSQFNEEVIGENNYIIRKPKEWI